MPNKRCYSQPDEFYDSLDQINFADLKLRGYRLIMLDLDNTLARHGSKEADDYARLCIRSIKEQGLACWIVTNAAKGRAGMYAASLELPFTALAGKPSPKAVLRVCQQVGLGPDRAALIGDQMLTDIGSANRAGCLSILVRPRFQDEPVNVRFKRILEKPLYRRYNLPVERSAGEKMRGKADASR